MLAHPAGPFLFQERATAAPASFGLFLLPFGRPPSLPFLREEVALRALVTSPRHAGQ